MLFGTNGYWIGFIASWISLVGALAAYIVLKTKTEKDDKLFKIAIDVKSMVDVFVKKMDSAVFLVAISIAVIVAFFDFWSAVCIVLGSGFSIIAGIIGMTAGSQTSHRVTHQANKHKGRVGPPLRIAFLGASVMAMAVTGLASLGITSIALLSGKMSIIFIGAFSMGATLSAVFSKNGGGMFSKGMDMAADLSGKVIAGLPEDHPYNPASKGDNAGDYVCDIKGTGLDMYDSYVAAIFSAITVVYAINPIIASMIVVFISIGTITTMIGISVMLGININKNPSLALSLAVYLTYGLFAVICSIVFIFTSLPWQLLITLIAGPLISGITIGISTNYFTGSKPVRQTAENGKTSVALAVLSGIEVGHLSVPIPVIAIIATIGLGYFLCQSIGPGWGIAGVALATAGLMANMGINVAVDVFGPIADNSKGIAEQAGLNEEAIKTLDLIDATGNTTAAYAKGIANGSAGLSMITLFVAFFEILGSKLGSQFKFDLMDSGILVKFIMGSLLGIASSYLFAAMTMAPARKIAFKVMDNIKKQFETHSLKERMENHIEPNYKSCANIATKGALNHLLPPVLTVVITTLLVRFLPFLGPIALAGYILGSNLMNLAIGFWMSNAGGNMDNAKKMCEAGELGHLHGKNSETHKALVQNDTVGDPLKDITGPGMNSLSALQSLIAIESIQLFPILFF